jgi:hypothetical protein
MEIVNKRLTQNQKIFFSNLTNYINEDIFYYGSILRPDFIKGKSDIDIDIFSGNEISTINKLSNYLNVNKNEFRKFVYKIGQTLVRGYKVKYSNTEEQIESEISIYNEKYKELVLKDHSKDRCLPFHITIALFIIKFLFYNLQILPKKIYKRCKRFLMNDNDELKFIEVDHK